MDENEKNEFTEGFSSPVIPAEEAPAAVSDAAEAAETNQFAPSEETVQSAEPVSEETGTPTVEEAPAQPTETPQTYEASSSGAPSYQPQAPQQPTAPAYQAPQYQAAQPQGNAPQGGAPAFANQNVNPYSQSQNPYGYQFGQGGYVPPQSPYSPYSQQNYQYPPRNPAPQTPPKKGMKTGTKVFFIIVAVALVTAIFTGVAFTIRSFISRPRDEGGYSSSSSSSSDDKSSTIRDDTNLQIDSSPSGSSMNTREIAQRVKKSLVGVVVYSNNGYSTSTSGEGSGIVMSRDGTGKSTYILTCAHVISDKGIKVKIETETGDSYDAEIVGFDTRTDVGVLKVDTTKLTPAEFGDSDALAVGDPVYAIGNPGGMEFFGSFTGGFVSAIDRPISSEIGYTMKCIQHDAAINPGNSGGPLVNEYGQVIGINSQKISNANYEGMGFAIPISSAQNIINNLIKYGYVPNRPKLGITYYPVSASTQYSMIARVGGLPAGTLIINEISSDSSLADTDARQYDMIIAVDGEELTTADVLLERIDKGKVGDKFTLTLCRVGGDYSLKKFDVDIVLVEDKGGSAVEETTTYSYIDPFQFYFGQ